MRKCMKYIISCMLAFPLILGGCRKDSEDITDIEVNTSEDYIGIGGNEARLNYDVPTMIPRVLTDQMGYEPGDKKEAIFHGKRIPSEFSIINEETGDVCYRGNVEETGFDEASDEYTGAGNFTAVVLPGTYHVFAEYLGESYSFTVEDDLYENLFAESCLLLDKLYSDENVTGFSEKDGYAVCNLMFIIEYYTSLLSDELGIPESGNGLPDLLDLTGRYAGQLEEINTDNLSCRELSSYIAAMSGISYAYKKYDSSFSAECLEKAKETLSKLQKTVSSDTEEAEFLAYSALYRADGNSAYKSYVDLYLGQHAGDEITIGPAFYGKIAYITCKHSVDTGLCNKIMTKLSSHVEKLTESMKENAYRVSDTNIEEECNNLVFLSIINYVITNHEYVTVDMDQLHFFLGRNDKAVCLVPGHGIKEGTPGIGDSAFRDSAFLMMLCEIMLE